MPYYMHDAHLPLTFWDEAAMTFVEVHNSSPTSVLPHQLLLNLGTAANLLSVTSEPLVPQHMCMSPRPHDANLSHTPPNVS